MSHDSVLLFIDAIEDDDAVVLIEKARYRLPRALLPPGAREGVWLRLALDTSNDTSNKTGEKIEAQRARLLGSDPGGKLKL